MIDHEEYTLPEIHPRANPEPPAADPGSSQSLAPRSVFLIAGTFVAALVLWQGRSILLNIGLVLILASLIATILQPVLRLLQRLPLPRWPGRSAPRRRP